MRTKETKSLNLTTIIKLAILRYSVIDLNIQRIKKLKHTSTIAKIIYSNKLNMRKIT